VCPPIVLVFDELAYFSATVGDRKQQNEFTTGVQHLVARGRAAGVIVVAATQRPSADIIPTSLRDLFGYRWAFRCTTPASSDVILGHSWASRGYSATDIDPSARGGGLNGSSQHFMIFASARDGVVADGAERTTDARPRYPRSASRTSMTCPNWSTARYRYRHRPAIFSCSSGGSYGGRGGEPRPEPTTDSTRKVVHAVCFRAATDAVGVIGQLRSSSPALHGRRQIRPQRRACVRVPAMQFRLEAHF
jgi:hypothetical protein